MNVKSYITTDYENKTNWKVRKNKPKTNPIQTQSKPILSAVGGLQMNVSAVLTKNYDNEQRTMNDYAKQTQYGPNQTRSEFIPKGAEIPTGELLGILKPGTNFKGKKTPKP